MGMGTVYDDRTIVSEGPLLHSHPPVPAADSSTYCAIVIRGTNLPIANCGSHSKRGAEVAALFYTLFESAKLAGVDPHRYVLEVTRRAIASPGAAIQWLRADLRCTV